MGEIIDKEIVVSVIVPLRNEEKYIDKCIQSILNQDYPLKNLEVIFVDGLSKDKTIEIVMKYVQQYSGTIKFFENPHKTVPYAMNIGIKNSLGKYIVRLDAHSEYSDDYISKCISTIDEFNSDNIGGLFITKGHGFIGEAFSKVLSSKFGVGNSGFRTNASSGYVDTVPFGTFRRETFEKYGLYDERLTRNQDYELNYRIRKNGGKIYLNSNIKLTYYCRNTLWGILKQSYDNGKWNIITSKLCPGSMSLRHFIPLFFLLSIIILPILSLLLPNFKFLFITELSLYFILNIIFTLKAASDLKQIFILIILFPMLHLSYGFGSLVGLSHSVYKYKADSF
ncbi:glycosyltransferase family 2 protein [Clostridium sp.]|jgi:glycosyltransferase involved in cell wall biosynthesis|uniref:glycosyltransferase family 2 protein n=1 Tax=Clostridium sp. TaxID=1506 RepID=UPI00258A75E2|nr:glycosyltransferase family 2 protein [Clostridium sp.]MDF2506013.1 glycosyl transferase [Clostridium sp.]